MGTFGLFNVFKWESEVGEITQVTHLFQSPIFKESDFLNLQTCSFHLNFFWCCCFPLQLMEENHMWNSESEFWLQLCFKTFPLFCGLSTMDYGCDHITGWFCRWPGIHRKYWYQICHHEVGLAAPAAVLIHEYNMSPISFSRNSFSATTT